MNLSLFGRRRKPDISTPSSSSSSKAANKHGKGLSSSLPPSSIPYGSSISPDVSLASPRHASQGTGQHQQTTSDTTDAMTSEFGAIKLPSRHPHTTSYSSEYHSLPLTNATGQSHRSSYAAFAQDPPPATDQRVHRRMSTGSIPPSHDSAQQIVQEEMQLAYGYWPIETQRELTLVQIEQIVRLCGREIKARGITEPLLFSSQALDISADGICTLIRTYVSAIDQWRSDIAICNSHDLAGMIKWALGRYQNPQGNRGFLGWQMYENWRNAERLSSFPTHYISSHLMPSLPSHNRLLLTTLFSLLTTAISHSTKNGCTAHKMSALFGAYIFGLPDDASFEHTYTAYNRFSHATEHLMLAYVRDQSHSMPGSIAPASLSLHLRDLITDYPLSLAGNLNKPPAGVQLNPVYRIRRQARFYTPDLIAVAGNWQVPDSASWAGILPASNVKSSISSSEKPPAFVYSSAYKHLLNIQSTDANASTSDLPVFKSVVDKEWKSFAHAGFTASDATKLKFDLTEGDRINRRKGYQSMDWSTFEGTGFTSEEASLKNQLNFDPSVNDALSNGGLASSEQKLAFAKKALAIQQSLPPFHYDVVPHEERALQVDKVFFEVYADVLCASGWTRDEIKEINWALIHFKTRPNVAQHEHLNLSVDTRMESSWFLVEEIIPADYRAASLQAAIQKPKDSRRISFLRSVRRKTPKAAAPPFPSKLPFSSESDTRATMSLDKPVSRHRSVTPNLRTPDASIFTSNGQTQRLTLSPPIMSNHNAITAIPEEDSEILHAVSRPLQYSQGKTIDQKPQRNSNFSGATRGPAGFFELVRHSTRKRKQVKQAGENRQSIMNTPDASTSTTSVVSVPAASGSNVPALTILQASPQGRQRIASYAGTTRTFDTRVTQGHSGAEGQDGQTLDASSRGHQDETDYGEVDCAPTPIDKSVPAWPIRPDHDPEGSLTPIKGRKTDDAHTRAVSVLSEIPYEDLDDQCELNRSDDVRTEPSDKTAQPIVLQQPMATFDESAATKDNKSVSPAFPSQALPQPQMYVVAASPERKPRSSSLQTAPAVSSVPLITLRAASAIPKPVTVQPSLQNRLRQEIDERMAALTRPSQPVAGSGRVAKIATKYSGA